MVDFTDPNLMGMPPPELGWEDQIIPPDMGGQMGMPPPDQMAAPAPELPPRFVPAELPPPTKAIRDTVFEHAATWMRVSRAFVIQKEWEWRRLLDLYENRIGYREFCEGKTSRTLDWSQNRAGSLKTNRGKEEGHRADWIYSIGHIVDRIVTASYPAIFEGPEWLVVSRQDKTELNQPAMPDISNQTLDDVPVSNKVQRFLLQSLEATSIHARVYDCLTSWVLFGTVFAKIFPWYQPAKTAEMDQFTGKVIELDSTAPGLPVVQMIPLDEILPDRFARNNDIQRWSGIGHRVVRTGPEIEDLFEQGVYTLNRDLFKEKAEAYGASEPSNTDFFVDPDATTDADDIPRYRVWEWYGLVPAPKGLREYTCTIITDIDSDNPEDGILVRVENPPLSMRPFACGHYYPQPGPFGIGAIERNEDLIQIISEIANQIQDNARVTAQGVWTVGQNSPIARQFKEDGGEIVPGKLYLVRDGNASDRPEPMNVPGFQAQTLFQELQHFESQLERRTLSDTFLGIGASRKTATEAQMLQQQSQGPVNALIHLFAQTFLRRVGEVCLELIRETMGEEHTLLIPNAFGNEVPVSITREELRSGKFVVSPSITKQDSTRIAKAQTVERFIQRLPALIPLLQQEGYQLSVGALTTRCLDFMGVEGIDQILRRLSSQEQMLIQANQDLQMQIQALTQPQPNPSAPPAGPGAGSAPPTGPPTFSGPPPEDMAAGGPMGGNGSDAEAMAKIFQMQSLMGQGGMPGGGVPEL